MATVSFEHPPVVEVTLGVGFNPLASWDIAAPGRFATDVPFDLAQVQGQPALPPIGIFPFAFPQQFLEGAMPRTWYVSKDATRLLQIQNNRLNVNWRKTAPTDAYPRYENLRELLDHALSALRAFILPTGEALTLSAFEVTYVNQLNQPGPSPQPLAIRDIIQSWFPPPEFPFPQQGYDYNVTASIDPQTTISVKINTFPPPPGTDAPIGLQLMVTGSLATPDALSERLQAARQAIAQTFLNITTSRAHKEWGRRE